MDVGLYKQRNKYNKKLQAEGNSCRRGSEPWGSIKCWEFLY